MISIRPRHSQIRALSTLETLISLAILTPCLLAGLALLSKSLDSYLKTSAVTTGQRSVIKLKEYLNASFVDYDTHRYSIPPRIHYNGLISFTNGELNSISHNQGAKKPDPDSDAITFGIIRGELTQIVQLVKHSEIPLVFLTCPTRNTPQPPLSQYKSFLGISVEGIFELSGSAKLWKKVRGTNCWIITVKQGISMWINQPDQIPAVNVFKIIPIEAIFTIFLNQANELRYLSSRSEFNIENQPLTTDILNLKFNLSETLGLVHLKTILTPKASTEYEFLINNRVTRHKLRTLLLNYP